MTPSTSIDTTNSTVVESPYSLDIEPTDVVSFVFSSGTASSRQKPQYFDTGRPSECFSLGQAETYVKQIGQGLQSLGLQPDDKVLVFSRNRLFFPVVLWGILAAGCVFTAASPSASVSELEYQLRDSQAKMLLTSPDSASVALDAAARLGLSRDKIYLFCDVDEDLSKYPPAVLQLRPWTDFWHRKEETSSWSWKRITTLEEATSTTAILNYSSGTTGFPKGVEISHYNVISNSAQLLHKRNLDPTTTQGRARVARLQTSGERWLAPLPMYHAFGQMYYCINAARQQAKVFIMARFDLSQYLLYLDIYRITFMTSVPTIMTMLTKHARPDTYNLHAVEMVTSGSAPLSPELARKFEQMYLRRGVQVKQGWGLTETTCSITGFAPDDVDDGRSIGWLNPNCRAKIVPLPDQDRDRDFAASTPSGLTATPNTGEIWVSGPNVMKGYYRKPRETAEVIVVEDGIRWLRTGDVGYIDKRGCLYIVDRLKELIKVKGLQVAPAELELALVSHPDVAEAAVVGAKINGAEYPRAFVVRRAGSVTVTEQELIDLIKQRFAPHKWLTGGVFFIDAIPRTGSGKVMRRHLQPGTGAGSQASLASVSQSPSRQSKL
ncbi:hypothetical protein A1O3_00267 [Capronia epimyces CBS 606.96]|uniref:4-coumarate-CoA ligase n=1 Tax=Capronia epimyces CBS 606.96 TaxID=1182542 RepID=W9YFP6_9EURO|nr:uncharacterized protein A1O3_00267 [Capronia epimyces CBS 606.96]EXJ91717.1 hypothetical protein A1O3_00267 [Capronia epimyces CBS 606.96]